MTRGTAVRGLLTVMAIAAGATSASAQVFGTFSWQMQPYCNTVTLTLTSVTGNFTLDGSDDQCGAAKKASATGIGVFNPDGTVGLNFTILNSPSGKAVHVSANVSPANGQGTWTDDSGRSGTFAFFGNTAGLPTRPVATSGDSHSIRRVTFTVNVATTAANFGTATNLATATFTPTVTGFALIRVRGYCNMTSQTVSPANLIIGAALDGETNINSFTDWVAMQLPTSATAQNTQLNFIAERFVAVTAGAARTATAKGYHESSTAPGANCRGSMTIEQFAGTLP